MSKKNLLAQELKRFKMISEYSFYIPDNELLDEDDDELEAEEGGEEMEEPQGEAGAEPEMSFDGEEIDPAMDDEAGMEPEAGMEDPGMEEPMDDLPEPEGDTNVDDDMGDPDMGGEEEIELDVTELVDKSEEAKASSEEAKASSDEANEKLNAMMQKFSELGDRMSKMDMLDKKLEALQQDIAKRNPTEEEKLGLRSMNSYPYNIKLSDYWDDKDRGNYKVDNGEGQTFKKEEEEEYVLTKDEVNSDYSEMSIKDTFNYTEEDM